MAHNTYQRLWFMLLHLSVFLCSHETGKETKRDLCVYLYEDGYVMWWSWWGLGNCLRVHSDPPGHSHMSPRCWKLLVRSTGIMDRLFSYLGGTTKASSCCWLRTSPAEPWESAEPVYSPHTAASLTGLTPLCCTFLMNPMIPFQKCHYCIFCDETFLYVQYVNDVTGLCAVSSGERNHLFK